LLELIHKRVGLAFGVLGFGTLAVTGVHTRFVEMLFESAGLGFAHGFVKAAMK
jgi:hypothetical protein